MMSKCEPQEEPIRNEPSKPKTELNKPKTEPKIEPTEPNKRKIEPKIEPKIELMNKPENEEVIDEPKATDIQRCKV
eukprot:8615839-Ditylum_brightwellii.AAC.1